MESLDLNSSFDIGDAHYMNLPTAHSLKASILSSTVRSLAQSTECTEKFCEKDKILTILSANLNKNRDEISIEGNEKTVNYGEEYTRVFSNQKKPDCKKARYVGNFHKQYLELGLWPEKNYTDINKMRQKYKTLRNRLSDSNLENLKLRSVKPKNTKCQECQIYKTKQTATKKALVEAIELSNVLLHEVKRLDGELIITHELRNSEYLTVYESGNEEGTFDNRSLKEI